MRTWVIALICSVLLSVLCPSLFAANRDKSSSCRDLLSRGEIKLRNFISQFEQDGGQGVLLSPKRIPGPIQGPFFHVSKLPRARTKYDRLLHKIQKEGVEILIVVDRPFNGLYVTANEAIASYVAKTIHGGGESAPVLLLKAGFDPLTVVHEHVHYRDDVNGTMLKIRKAIKSAVKGSALRPSALEALANLVIEQRAFATQIKELRRDAAASLRSIERERAMFTDYYVEPALEVLDRMPETTRAAVVRVLQSFALPSRDLRLELD